MGTTGQGLEILNCRISIVMIPTGRQTRYSKLCQRPAPVGLFTIGELQSILTTVQVQPFRDKFFFVFPHGKYLVTTYDANPHQS